MRWIRYLSLRYQIVLLVVAFTLAVGLGNTLRTHLALNDLAKEQFKRRSVATATGLAAQVVEPVITNDLFGLYDLINTALLNTPDMRYVVVLDGSGQVQAHTFGPGLPRGLVKANSLGTDGGINVRRLRTEEGVIIDVAAPLPEGAAGVLRLGMSEQALTAAVDRHTLQLLALTVASLIPVLTFTYILGTALTRPLLQLVDVTRAIARGDWRQQAPTEGRDEVAQLGASFNAMTKALAASQAALQQSNQELQERNEELATLYTIATAISFTDSTEELATAALEKVLDVLNLRAGWIFLSDVDNGSDIQMVVARGLPVSLVAAWREQVPADCIPADLQAMQQATVTHDGDACPHLSRLTADEAIVCHTAIPLRSRARVWGVMHVVCPHPSCFSSHRLGLLTAIGHQIGVAIENTHLAAAHQRQVMRRRLLDQVMAAQEEERRRIAREMHDELAQSLIVLMRNLERMAAQFSSDNPILSLRIQNTRALVQRTLDQTRSLIFDLRPTVLDDLGLLPALRHYAHQRLQDAGIHFALEVTGQVQRLPSKVETALFRIAQESIINVVRHARATRVRLTLDFDSKHVQMQVEDNGIGFDAAAISAGATPSSSIGLLGMRERADLLGGDVHIHSRPHEGVTITVNIPLETYEENSSDAG